MLRCCCQYKEQNLMATLSEGLESKLQRNQSASVRVIIKVIGKPSSHLAALESLGLIVHRAFTLIPALAIEGPASAILSLANEPWVLSIEEDRQVRIM
jgi:hypothetical protein